MAVERADAMTEKLLKAETVALWYAVESMVDAVRVMPDCGCTPDQVDAERERLKLAKQALRKVNKFRKQGL